jgi:hypothetical protein
MVELLIIYLFQPSTYNNSHLTMTQLIVKKKARFSSITLLQKYLKQTLYLKTYGLYFLFESLLIYYCHLFLN